MVTLNALSTASSLLQHITSKSNSPLADAEKPLLGQTSSIVSTSTDAATKSVSTAIFNAVAQVSEKQDETIKAVLAFIERDYTDFDKKFSFLVEAYGHEPGVQANIADAKRTGELLKQQVLSNPAEVYRQLEQIKASRPNMSSDGTIGILIKSLNQQNSR